MLKVGKTIAKPAPAKTSAVPKQVRAAAPLADAAVAAAKQQVLDASAAVVNKGLREAFDRKTKELTEYVDRVLNDGLTTRIKTLLTQHFRQEYEIVKVPYDTKWALLEQMIDAGYHVLDVVPPAMARMTPTLREGYVLQRMKGAKPCPAVAKAQSGSADSKRSPEPPPTPEPTPLKVPVKPRLKVRIGVKK